MQNPYLSYASARLACMFYFMAPGLAYGLVTSRMPALKNMTGATEGELGIILLCFGLSALIGLAFAPRLIAKISAKTTLLASSLACMVFVVLVSFSSSVWFFGIAMALLGICMGLCDVTMNVQGVEVERAYKKSSMNILHAGYNIGAAAAACAGSIFAATNFGVWVNFVLPVAVMAGMLWWAEPRLVTGNLEKPERSESSPLVSVEPKSACRFWFGSAGCCVYAVMFPKAASANGEVSIFIRKKPLPSQSPLWFSPAFPSVRSCAAWLPIVCATISVTFWSARRAQRLRLPAC